MARIKPSLSEAELQLLPSSAEAKFYACCRSQLPTDCLVLFSVPWIGSTYSGKKYDGEADFTIFSPRFGMLVIEVKGGGIEFDPGTGDWHSTDRNGIRHPIKNPFEQAKREKHALLKILLNYHPSWRSMGRGHMLACHGVFFPDSDSVDLRGPGSPDQIVGSSRDLSRLPDWTNSVFEFWAGEDDRWSPLGDSVELVEKILSSPLVARPLLSSILKEEENKRIELTEQQARVLRAIGSRRNAIIKGGAGTGKTVLALEQAGRLAEKGNRTLLVCFNRMLADHLILSCEGQDNLDAMSFHQLCDWRIQTVMHETGRDLLLEMEEEFPGEDEFEVHFPSALAVSCDILEEKYDAIVVDEGQDFKENFWLALSFLLQDESEGTFFVFLDPNQAIYTESLEDIPIQEEPFLLTINCRNTKFIHDSAYRFFKGDIIDPPTGNPGAPIKALEATALREQARLIHEGVSRLLVAERLDELQIIVLIAGMNKESYYSELRDMRLPNGIEWNVEGPVDSRGVRVDTVRRFKGLEGDVVFLWGIDDLQLPNDKELLYVGISRTKSRLFVVGARESCRHCLKFGE